MVAMKMAEPLVEQNKNHHMEWRYPQHSEYPWLDYRLSKDVMNHLWECTNNPIPEIKDDMPSLAGNISKSTFIQDKDNWFYENVLKGMTDTLYYKLWNNYYETIITKSKLPTV